MVKVKSFKAADGRINTDIGIDPFPGYGAPEGRVPVGDGWYKTPDIIDPRDCANYPDSPFCGGNPLTRDPVGIDIGVNFHECGFDVDIQGTLGFTKLPVHGFSYRSEGVCRQEPPEIIPPSPIDNIDANYQPIPLSIPPGFNDTDDVVLVTMSRDVYYYLLWEQGEYKSYAYQNGGTLTNVRYPGVDLAFLGGYPNETSFAQMDYERTSYKRDVPNPGSSYMHPRLVYTTDKLYRRISSFEGDTGDPVFHMYHGQFRNIIDNLGVPSREYEEYETTLSNGSKIIEKTMYANELFILYIKKTGSQYEKNPPAPDHNEDKECCMTCCSPTNKQQDQNNDLLKKILKKVEKIEKRTWDGDDDVKMPASLRQETNWLSSVLPPPQKILTNLPQLNTHIFKLFEEVIGEWDLNIQIKDTDPATPGDQPKGMKVPAISEAFGEVLGTTIQSTINTEVLINMMSRCMYEIGVNRQATMDANYAVRALIDYFGFKTVDAEEKMPMAFTPGKDKIEDMLKEYEHTLQVIRFDDEKNSYKSDMLKLLSTAAAWRAQNMRKVNPIDKAAAVQDIINRVKQLRDSQNKQDETISKKVQEDFDAWVERYERGFTDIPNIDDSVNPFGEDLSVRPRVIRLDKQTGNDNTPS